MLWCDCEATPFATTFLGDKKAVEELFKLSLVVLIAQ